MKNFRNSIVIKFRIVILSLFISSLPLFAATNDADQIEAIGSYSNGCIRNGGIALKEAEGFQIVRSSRERYYAHPDAIQFIQRVGSQAKAKKLGTLMVADISQKYGGLMPWGHRSHQIGLDVDFLFPYKGEFDRLDSKRAENAKPISVLKSDHSAVDPEKWEPRHQEILKIMALDPKVDRIFVHPMIKLHLCRATNQEDWLRKLRPWYGHHNHFHVRLKCPSKDKDCRPTVAIPAGTSCKKSDMSWWFSKKANLFAVSSAEPQPTKEKRKIPNERKHPRCRAIPESS